MSKIPSDEILESLYKLRIRESAQLKTVLELYDMEIHQKISISNYQKLKTMVKRSVDQKLRLRNFDAGHWSRIVRRSGVEGRKGTCYQWKEKGQCSQGDRCSFRHETQDCAQKHHEVEVCRGRERIRSKSNHRPHSSTTVQILSDKYLYANAL